MKSILGLDVSSACIGWALVYFDEKSKQFVLSKCGHIKPDSKKKAGGNLSLRLNSAYIPLTELLLNLNPHDVAIEDYARKFEKGRSSANTIIVLSSFNEVISLACLREANILASKYTVSSLRSIVGKHFGKKITSKEEAFSFICETFKNSFSVILNKNGNIKKELYDEADAVFVALAHLIVRYNEKEKK